MAPLDIEVRAVGYETDIALYGELDSAGCDSLRECMEALDASVRTVVVDLAGLTFIDAAGVSTLLGISDQLALDLRRLEIVSAGEQVQHVLELTGATAALGLH